MNSMIELMKQEAHIDSGMANDVAHIILRNWVRMGSTYKECLLYFAEVAEARCQDSAIIMRHIQRAERCSVVASITSAIVRNRSNSAKSAAVAVIHACIESFPESLEEEKLDSATVE